MAHLPAYRPPARLPCLLAFPNATAPADLLPSLLLPCPTSCTCPAAAVGVGAVAMLMSKDLKQSSAMLRRNMRHIRTWLEEQGAAAE